MVSSQETKNRKSTPRTGGAKTSRIRADINAGVCGFNTTVVANAESMRDVKLDIQSECKAIQKVAEQLTEIDMLEETKSGIGQGVVYEVLSNCARHAACPVGSGILKAAEAASGLALPRDASITLSKEEDED